MITISEEILVFYRQVYTRMAMKRVLRRVPFPRATVWCINSWILSLYPSLRSAVSVCELNSEMPHEVGGYRKGGKKKGPEKMGAGKRSLRLQTCKC